MATNLTALIDDFEYTLLGEARTKEQCLELYSVLQSLASAAWWQASLVEATTEHAQRSTRHSRGLDLHKARARRNPVHKHDCVRCKYLGRYEARMGRNKYDDLYYCPEEGSLIARFGDDEAEYRALPLDIVQKAEEPPPSLREALRRAKQAALIPTDP